MRGWPRAWWSPVAGAPWGICIESCGAFPFPGPEYSRRCHRIVPSVCRWVNHQNNASARMTFGGLGRPRPPIGLLAGELLPTCPRRLCRRREYSPLHGPLMSSGDLTTNRLAVIGNGDFCANRGSAPGPQRVEGQGAILEHTSASATPLRYPTRELPSLRAQEPRRHGRHETRCCRPRPPDC